MQGFIGVGGLVRRVAIEQRRRLIGHHLFQDRGDGFALGEPLPADARQQFGRVGLVEADSARDPAIFEGLAIELIQQSRPCGRGESDDGEAAQMRPAQTRRQPADKRAIGQERIEMHRRFGQAQALTTRRHGRMQKGQCLFV